MSDNNTLYATLPDTAINADGFLDTGVSSVKDLENPGNMVAAGAGAVLVGPTAAKFLPGELKIAAPLVGAIAGLFVKHHFVDHKPKATPAQEGPWTPYTVNLNAGIGVAGISAELDKIDLAATPNNNQDGARPLNFLYYTTNLADGSKTPWRAWETNGRYSFRSGTMDASGHYNPANGAELSESDFANYINTGTAPTGYPGLAPIKADALEIGAPQGPVFNSIKAAAGESANSYPNATEPQPAAPGPVTSSTSSATPGSVNLDAQQKDGTLSSPAPDANANPLVTRIYKLAADYWAIKNPASPSLNARDQATVAAWTLLNKNAGSLTTGIAGLLEPYATSPGAKRSDQVNNPINNGVLKTHLAKTLSNMDAVKISAAMDAADHAQATTSATVQTTTPVASHIAGRHPTRLAYGMRHTVFAASSDTTTPQSPSTNGRAVVSHAAIPTASVVSTPTNSVDPKDISRMGKELPTLISAVVAGITSDPDATHMSLVRRYDQLVARLTTDGVGNGSDMLKVLSGLKTAGDNYAQALNPSSASPTGDAALTSARKTAEGATRELYSAVRDLAQDHPAQFEKLVTDVNNELGRARADAPKNPYLDGKNTYSDAAGHMHNYLAWSPQAPATPAPAPQPN